MKILVFSDIHGDYRALDQDDCPSFSAIPSLADCAARNRAGRRVPTARDRFRVADVRSETPAAALSSPFRDHALAQVRNGDLSGQSLPDPLWRRGESLKTMHDHSAQ